MEDHSFDINVHGSGYNIGVMVVSGFVFGISVSNTVYFSRLAEHPSESVGKKTANTMMIMNILVSLLLGAIFVWSSYKLIVSHESKYHTMSKYIHSAKHHSQTHANAFRPDDMVLESTHHAPHHYAAHHYDDHHGHPGHHVDHHGHPGHYDDHHGHSGHYPDHHGYDHEF
jgi:hypothetical protein